MKVIIFLGNPGKEYAKTRHNVGFVVANTIAQLLDLSWQTMFGLEFVKTGDYMLVKPMQYMNVAGSTTKKYLDYFKVDAKEVVAVYDDMDLETGKVRVRKGGGSGGHHGVDSIIEAIGEDFWRVRIGIGNDKRIPGEIYVLSNPSKEEKPLLNQSIIEAAEIVKCYITGETELSKITKCDAS